MTEPPSKVPLPHAACLEAALGYLARGWSVVPLRPQEKAPLIPWEAYQHRHPTEAEVREWYVQWPEAGVGIVTGAISNLVVIDVDVGHGGAESLETLGPLPDTVEALTGGGGRHLYFAHPTRTVHSRVGVRPGLDVRADGGLVVAPPSVHPSGRRYQWRPGHSPDDREFATMPVALQLLLLRRPSRSDRSIEHWRELLRDGVEAGARNATIASLTGRLLWDGLDVEMITELLLCWNRVRCRPPLSDDEVVATVESIARTHARGNGEA